MSWTLALFLVQTVGISLSGVMSPGAVTAATLAAGVRQRHAGTLVALGHGAIELPLMALLVAGLGAIIQTRTFGIGIGLVGGLALILLAISMGRSSAKAGDATQPSRNSHPFWTGVVLTIGNPLFLVWWATAGLALLTQAWSLGLLALALCGLVHWLCDLLWLEFLSQASFSGTHILGPKGQRLLLGACALAMGLFGIKFVLDATRLYLAA